VKSWKTTLGGILLAIGGWASTQSDPWWLYKAGGLLNVVGALILGMAARDNNVPSAAVPAALRAEEKLEKLP
tara:strand:- start:142 stop:357 length:216 start_codon:yes stop_codon:yes gene_type:complete